MNDMTHRERVTAALNRQPTDRPAVSLWRHFGGIDMNPDGLTAAVIDFQQQYDFDFVKFMPTGAYPIIDWGAETVWEPRPTGSRTVTRLPIARLEDWNSVQRLDVDSGFLKLVNQSLRDTIRAIGRDTPVLQTVFSPMTIAVKLAGPAAFAHMRTQPDVIERALETITDVTSRMISAAIDRGADIFYAVQTGSADLLTKQEFERWETAYARRLLEPIKERSLILVHCHGNHLWFDEFGSWPVSGLNWDDRRTGPSVASARQRTAVGLCAGVSHYGSLRNGTAPEVRAEIEEALSQAGRELVVGPGCVIPMDCPPHLIRAARLAVEAWPSAGSPPDAFPAGGVPAVL